MKTKSFIIIILIIVINMIFFNINIVQAEGISDVIKGGDDFIASGSNDTFSAIDETVLKSASDVIYNILLIIGMCIAVIVAGMLGIKFMIGSVEEKAQIKDALVPFIIGCIVVFGAFGLWKIAINLFSGIGSN